MAWPVGAASSSTYPQLRLNSVQSVGGNSVEILLLIAVSTFHCTSTVFWAGRNEVWKPVKCEERLVWCYQERLPGVSTVCR